ncbi:MAG: Gfo/Idh/MocA family protein [Mangrovibacterium sp.]
MNAKTGGRINGANEKIVLGLIGAGGRGTSMILDFYRSCRGVEVKYICDVDASRGGHAINELGKMQGFRPQRVEDMRRVYDDKDVDAVIIATPEHWHALSHIWACQAGKHVYVEKVISMSINEGEKMIEATNKYNRIVQCGTQNRSGDFAFSARDYIQSGKLGKIISVKSYCIFQGAKPWMMKEDSPVPQGLNWDMWLGPAHKVPYNVSRHKAPYDWWEYSPGLQMAMANHVIDLARMVIGDPDDPQSVYSSGGRVLYDDKRNVPDFQAVTYDYKDFVMTLECGIFSSYMDKTKADVRFGKKFPNWRVDGTRIEIYGTQGLMYLGIMGGGWQVFDPNGNLRDQEYGYFPDENHQRNFIDCLRKGNTPNADIIQGHKSACLIHLANLAYRTGNRQLYYDAKEGQITNSPEANEISLGDYRAPYVIPDKI